MPASSKAQQRWAGLMYGNPQLRKEAGISKASARKLAKTKHEGLPEKVSEAMNFTEYLEATEGVEPLYQVEGKGPSCPPGFRWDMKTMRCVPKTKKDNVGPRDDSKDSKPENNGAEYNIWGKTGVNGDGYAYAEPNNWGN